MPQMHLYLPEHLAAEVRLRAAARHVSVSAYLADLVRAQLEPGWPPDFLSEVLGGWVGEPLTRPEQGDYEERSRW